MNTRTARLFSRLTTILCALLCFSAGAKAQTFTSITSGNWGAGATWAGGIAPPAVVTIAQSVLINHSVTYDLSSDLDLLGAMRIESISPAPAAPGALILPAGRNFTVRPTGSLVLNYGQIRQCRFTSCGDSGAVQAGLMKNEGGLVTVTFSVVEIAQDWTNESGGRRFISDSCVKTGQNFSLSGATSFDELRRTSISVGWHGSGSIQHNDGTGVYGPGLKFQLAGTSGSFELNSGTVSGAIEFITLKNNVTNFTGSGQIIASSSLNVGARLSLGTYWLSPATNYIPNGKFTGSQTLADLTATYFPDNSCTFSNTFLPQQFSCTALYGSYSGAAATNFDVRSVSTLNGQSTDFVTVPALLPNSRGNAAAISPDGRYYFYRRDTGNRLMRYDSLTQATLDTGQIFSQPHDRMAIEPSGVFGYAGSTTVMQRFLVAAPYTISAVSIVNQAPTGAEYTVRTGEGDFAFDASGVAWATARRLGGGLAGTEQHLYRMQFSTTTASVTATFLGQITSTNAAFSNLDINGVAFEANTLYLGGANNALGGDAEIWRFDFNTRQATLVGTDTVNSNNILVTDMVSCNYPSLPLLPAHLAVTKTNGTTTLSSGQTTSYTITFSNSGPYPVYNALVLDTPSIGLSNCNVSSCTALGGSICPASFANFVAPGSGVPLPILTEDGSLTVLMQCTVTATGF